MIGKVVVISVVVGVLVGGKVNTGVAEDPEVVTVELSVMLVDRLVVIETVSLVGEVGCEVESEVDEDVVGVPSVAGGGDCEEELELVAGGSFGAIVVVRGLKELFEVEDALVVVSVGATLGVLIVVEFVAVNVVFVVLELERTELELFVLVLVVLMLGGLGVGVTLGRIEVVVFTKTLV